MVPINNTAAKISDSEFEIMRILWHNILKNGVDVYLRRFW